MSVQKKPPQSTRLAAPFLAFPSLTLPISSLTFFSSPFTMPASLLATTTSQPIYYVFSNRVPNLLQSTSQPFRFPALG